MSRIEILKNGVALSGRLLQSGSSLRIDLICSGNSGVFSCRWAETACCTAAVTQELMGNG